MAHRVWPNSDDRIDTAQAAFHFYLDRASALYVEGMPLLINLDTDYIFDLKVSGSGYAFNYYVDGVLKPGTMSKEHVDWVTEYYPAYFSNLKEPDAEAAYTHLRNRLLAATPSQLFGSYISGTRCRDAVPKEQFPRGIIDCCEIQNHDPEHPDWRCHELLNPACLDAKAPDRWYVDPRDNDSVGQFRSLIMQDVSNRVADFIFFDNMQNVGFANESDVKCNDCTQYVDGLLAHLSALSSGVDGLGKGALFNTGKFPHAIAGSKRLWPDLLNGLRTHGIYLEDAIYGRKGDSELVAREIRGLRSLLKHECLVVVAPLDRPRDGFPNGADDPGGAEWTTALAMIIRDPGQSLFIATQAYVSFDDTRWRRWPHDFGPASSPASRPDPKRKDWVRWRRFAQGDIAVVHMAVPSKSNQSVVLPDAIGGAGNPWLQFGVPDHAPFHGTWSAGTASYDYATPPAPKCEDRFILYAEDWSPSPLATTATNPTVWDSMFATGGKKLVAVHTWFEPP